MTDVLFDPLIGGLERVLDLRVRQHALTASNLANADTPGFKAKELDFEHALKSAVGYDDHGVRMSRSDARHFPANDLDALAPVRELEAPPWSLDGNSVHPERETARMQSNSLLYNAVAQGLSRHLQLLRYAASDGKA